MSPVKETPQCDYWDIELVIATHAFHQYLEWQVLICGRYMKA